MSSAAIIGLATPAGAYLARLLRARGYRVSGTATDPDAARAMLATLGADEVTLRAGPFDGPAPAEAYLLDGSLTLADALAGWPAARLLTIDRHAGARDARFAVVASLGEHVSRLDPVEHPVLATCRAVRDGQPLPAVDAIPRDLGWTPEYVDALWRLLQADAPHDAVVATGVALGQADIAAYAAEYFKRPAALPFASPQAAVADAPADWRAFTYGRELVRALCEGLSPG